MQDTAGSAPFPSRRPTRSSATSLKGHQPRFPNERNPYITLRDGPTGPRAALIDGPDIWEVIQTIDGHQGDREAAILAAAELLNLTEQQVQAALDHRAANREEIDARIELNAQTLEPWGDLSKLVAATTAETLRRLDAQERAAGLDPW